MRNVFHALSVQQKIGVLRQTKHVDETYLLVVLFGITTAIELGFLIQALREKRGLTLGAFGELVGHTDAYQAKIEKGKAVPTVDTAKRMAAIFNIERELFGEVVQGVKSYQVAKRDNRLDEFLPMEERVNAFIQGLRPVLNVETLKVNLPEKSMTSPAEVMVQRARLKKLVGKLYDHIDNGDFTVNEGRAVLNQWKTIFEEGSAEEGIKDEVCMKGGNNYL